MSANTIEPKLNMAANTLRGPSPSIWADCPVLDLKENFGLGMIFEDDFMNFSQHISDQDVQQYSSYIDTGVTIKATPTNRYGEIEVAGNDADNDEGSITTGGGSGVLAVITDDGTAGKLWFECRIKKASVADNALAFFVGLSEEGMAIADALVNDTGALKTTADFIGFRVLQDNGEELDFVWQKASQTAVEFANIATLVADTYVKLGFVYDHTQPGANRITVFVNGLAISTFGTSTQLAAATFPSGEELALLLATKVGTAAESKFEMDWWRVAQLGNS